MLALADAIDAHADELAELESLDNGKPVKLARRVDVPLAAAHLRYFAGLADARSRARSCRSAQPNMHCYTRKEPVGVCGQIIPWNFPLLMAAWKIAPALAAGCTIVLKPAEQTPLTALRLGELALEAGIPAGVLNVVTGDGETGAALVDHPDVDKIAFTGSTAVGPRDRREGRPRAQARDARARRQVAEHHPARRRPRRPRSRAPSRRSTSTPARPATPARGCSCTRTSSTTSSSGARRGAPARRRLGPGLDPDTQLGPLVSAEQHERVRGYIETGKAEGAELVTGGERARGRRLLRRADAVQRDRATT